MHLWWYGPVPAPNSDAANLSEICTVQCAVPRPALPLLASATMLATSLTALTTGRFAKGRGVSTRNTVLVAGCLMLTAANVLLSLPFAANMAGMMAACVCIGVHMGMTHGLALSMLSSYMPQDRIPGAPRSAGLDPLLTPNLLKQLRGHDALLRVAWIKLQIACACLS